MNPPLEGLECGVCARDGVHSAIFLVAVEPRRSEAADYLATVHGRDDKIPLLIVEEWVCTAGHQVGVVLNGGELDLGVIRRTTVDGQSIPADQIPGRPADLELPVCPGCGERAVDCGNFLQTSHDRTCSWLNDPMSVPYY